MNPAGLIYAARPGTTGQGRGGQPRLLYLSRYYKYVRGIREDTATPALLYLSRYYKYVRGIREDTAIKKLYLSRYYK